MDAPRVFDTAASQLNDNMNISRSAARAARLRDWALVRVKFTILTYCHKTKDEVK